MNEGEDQGSPVLKDRSPGKQIAMIQGAQNSLVFAQLGFGQFCILKREVYIPACVEQI